VSDKRSTAADPSAPPPTIGRPARALAVWGRRLCAPRRPPDAPGRPPRQPWRAGAAGAVGRLCARCPRCLLQSQGPPGPRRRRGL